ncbi:MAG: carbamate kinase [Bacillota bacterium]
MGGLVVIALGGNAILQPGQRGTVAEQQANIRAACQAIAEVVQEGWQVVLTHGNGPQVGNLLLQSEEASGVVPPATLDVCGAQTQGMLGYLIQQELSRATGRTAVSVVTQVVVDPADSAFGNPTKTVGPFYTEARARKAMAERGWQMREDAGRGWRRVVPSPHPVRVVEAELIQRLVDAGTLVIAAGGGGVPVADGPDGLHGIEAVIDKDRAATVLALGLGAEKLIILTDVEHVCLHYRRPEQVVLREVTVSEGLGYLAQGHFRAGSMGPKVEAAVAFVEASGGEAVIGSLTDAARAVAGLAGTRFVPDEGGDPGLRMITSR